MKQFLVLSILLWFRCLCDASELSVVTSIRPLALLAADVIGEDGRVEAVAAGAASPHQYALKVSDINRLREADLVIWVGPELERFFIKPLQNLSVDKKLQLANMESLEWPVASLAPGYTDRDPHIWLNPRNGARMAEAIAGKLSLLAPAGAAGFFQRADKLAAGLRQRDEEWRWRFSKLTKKGFGVFHDGYNHFVGTYGLNQVAAVTTTPERAPGARHLYAVRGQLAKNASCLFVEPYYRTKVAENLAEELNLPLVQLDPLGEKATSYPDLIDRMAKMFIECLSG